MLKSLLESRHLPPLPEENPRQTMLSLLAREVYGVSPAAPDAIHAHIESDEPAFGGKARLRRIRISFDTPAIPFSFPYMLLTPADGRAHPAFAAINFEPAIPHKYLPAEEIIDHGYALACLYYQDITSDSGEWDGLAMCYPRNENTGWGKIGMWAFALSRVMDDLQTRPEIDGKRICVTGHSRLGKTALWCAAQDERFSMAVSNDSGCAGAALARGNTGERVRNIVTRFPYWFCGNYAAWADREAEMPFDQHMLLALLAPRRLYVSSAREDAWAHPENEFLSCVAASDAWRACGLEGLSTPDSMPQDLSPLHRGHIGYHIRPFGHFFSRTDWLMHMAYRDMHRV
ncbi:MAG: hypothetical protein E7324_07635 [Clostridiales bacterium]|nr:hypothetical protein [Clostridiales bacterium]